MLVLHTKHLCSSRHVNRHVQMIYFDNMMLLNMLIDYLGCIVSLKCGLITYIHVGDKGVHVQSKS
jgi:hypothetical protein